MKLIHSFILLSILLLSTASANSIKKYKRKLKRAFKIDIEVNENLIKNKDYCTRLMLENWHHWWKQVKSPYKEKYLKSIRHKRIINIDRSVQSQEISGNYTSLYLVKQSCSGSGLGRSCKTLDSQHLKLKKDIKIIGEPPQFDLDLSKSIKVGIEFTSDHSHSKRYDTFTRAIYRNVKRDISLFDRYARFGQVSQIVKPGTDRKLKKHCSYPRLDEVLTKIRNINLYK